MKRQIVSRKQVPTRGTDMHTLTEHYLKNDQVLPEVPPISDFYLKSQRGNLTK